MFGIEADEIDIKGIHYVDPKPFIGNMKIDVAFEKADEIRQKMNYILEHNPQEKVQIPNQKHSSCLQKSYFSVEFLLFLKHVPNTALFVAEFLKDKKLLDSLETASKPSIDHNKSIVQEIPTQLSDDSFMDVDSPSKKTTKRKVRYSVSSDSTQRYKRNDAINVISSKLDEIAVDAEDMQVIFREALTKTRKGKEKFPEFFETEVKEALGDNLIEEIKKIPKTDRTKNILISYFFRGIRQTDAASILGVCTKTIQRSFTIEEPLAELKLLGTKRKRVYIGSLEIEFIKVFFEIWVQTPSGGKERIQFFTNAILIHRYEQYVSTENAKMHTNFKTRCPNTLFKLRKQFKIKHKLGHDAFACSKCEALDINQEMIAKLEKDFTDQYNWNEEKNKKLQLLRSFVADALQHKETNPHQRAEFQFQKDVLKDDEAILVIDFTTKGEWGADHQFQILVMVQLTRDPVSKAITLENFDAFGEDEENDCYFMKRGMEEYLSKFLPARIKKVYLWSDGGPKHFKQKKSMYFMSQLAEKYKISIDWNFYCSCHAHNLCDSHAAVLKRILVLFVRMTGKKIPNTAEFKEILLDYPIMFKFKSKITPIPLKDIDRTPLEVTEIYGIRCELLFFGFFNLLFKFHKKNKQITIFISSRQEFCK